MANILDPVTGKPANVNADGSLQIFEGGDGLATYSVALAVTRLAAASTVGALLWGLRAPSTRTVVLKGGVIRVHLDTVQAAMAENAFVMVRFTGADPAGGTVFVAGRKKTAADPVAVTTVIRGGAGLTSTGITFESDVNALARISYPGNAGHYSELQLRDLNGFELAPGEGLAMRGSTALPIGTVVSGFLEFSERV